MSMCQPVFCRRRTVGTKEEGAHHTALHLYFRLMFPQAGEPVWWSTERDRAGAFAVCTAVLQRLRLHLFLETVSVQSIFVSPWQCWTDPWSLLGLEQVHPFSAFVSCHSFMFASSDNSLSF